MSECRSCGARIGWYKTKAGKNLPVDHAPDPGGNVFCDEGAGIAWVVPVGSAPTLYRSHFATCPNAATHRRRKETK